MKDAAKTSGPLASQWVILALALFALGFLLVLTLWQERRAIIAREQERMLFQTSMVEKLLVLQLSSLDAVLKDLSDEGDDTLAMDFNTRLKTLVDGMSGVRTLVRLDSAGRVVACNRPEVLGQDLSHREYFAEIRKHPDPGRLFVGRPFHTSLGSYTIPLARMVTKSDGAFDGVIAASLDPAYFAPLLKSTLYSADMWSVLVHEDGVVFLMEPDREGVQGRILDERETFFGDRLEDGGGARLYKGKVALTDEDRLVAVRTIKPPELNMDHALVLGLSRDLDRLLRAWSNNAFSQVTLYGLAVLSTVLGLAAFQRKRLVHEREMAKAARSLADRERFIRTITDNIPGMVGYWDLDLRCRYANNAYLEWFGKSQEQMKEITLPGLLGPQLYALNEPYVLAALAGKPQQFERILTKADGSTGYTLARYIPDTDNGKVLGFFVLVTDVTDLKTAQVELEQRVRELDVLATTDHLTGLSNRRHFLARANEEHERNRRYRHPMVFLMLDIDHFKAINDAYGHDGGDKVLKALAATLKDTLRTTDIVGRLGGEEFGALLVETGQDDAKNIAERLRSSVANAHVPVDGGSVAYTISIGLSVCLEGDCTIEAGMKRADSALYAAKQSGRNRVCTFLEAPLQSLPLAQRGVQD